MLLHARKRHIELFSEVRDRCVGAAELLQHGAAGRVRQRSERSVQLSFAILNHMVQYIAERFAPRKGNSRSAASHVSRFFDGWRGCGLLFWRAYAENPR